MQARCRIQLKIYSHAATYKVREYSLPLQNEQMSSQTTTTIDLFVYFRIQKKGSVQKRRDLLSLDDMASDVVVLTSSESEGVTSKV